ncbi:MAG: dihydroorotase [Victivallales bacterium]|nr:dihydroorotase [Victivallales bacterium]
MKGGEGDILFSNGRVVDPANGKDRKGDVAVSGGKIVKPSQLRDPRVVDVGGLVVSPGLIDMHVHLRQPGRTDKETIRTGTQAAAAGGFTTVLAMPNTSPVTDNPGTIEYVRRHAAEEGVVKVLVAAAMTVGQKGESMSSIGSLKKCGVAALTDDGSCVQNHEVMRHIVEYAKTFSLPILDHCEDANLASDGVMHEGKWSVLLGLRGIPAAAEELMVARDIILSEIVGWKIHIQHISTRGSVRMVREARKRGVPVSAEVTPHHLAITDEVIKSFDTNYKVSPPIRSSNHIEALVEGLADGTITCIASDHAPHTETEKLVEFDYAPNGVIGLETALTVCLTCLYHKKLLSLPELVSKFTVGPAEVLGINAGTLDIGANADITIFNPDEKMTVDKSKFRSKSRNTPFHGWDTRGRVCATIVDGKPVFSRIKGL